MAQNNYWDIKQGKVIPQPQPIPPSPSYPKNIILDQFAESVIQYTLSYNDLTALETIYIIANTTTIGSALTIYVPNLPTVITEPKKISFINMGVDTVQIENPTGGFINLDSSYIINLDPYAAPPVSGTVSSVTLIPDTQLASPSWFTLYNYYNL